MDAREPANVAVARQPVFDAQRRVVGYELLYRAEGASSAEISDHDEATQQMLSTALMRLDLDELTDGKRIFLHVSERFLAQGWHRLLPPGRTVFELVVTREIDRDVAELLSDVSSEGYQVAYDGYRFGSDSDWLLDHLDVVKVDLALNDLATLGGELAALRTRPLTLVAEKVETHAQFELCQQMGFDLFQGWFFQKPELMGTGAALHTSRVAIFELMNLLDQPNMSVDAIAGVIERDVALTHRLLKVANSPYFGLRTQVESVRQCVMLLGTRMLRQMAMLLVVASGGVSGEVTNTSLVRAKWCESLSERIERPEAGFTAGLLSLVDVVSGQSKADAMAELPVTAEIAQAVVEGTGALGRILNAVERYERGELDAFEDIGIPTDAAHDAYLAALAWARSVTDALDEEPGDAD